jgi:hypothetical protein
MIEVTESANHPMLGMVGEETALTLIRAAALESITARKMSQSGLLVSPR